MHYLRLSILVLLPLIALSTTGQDYDDEFLPVDDAYQLDIQLNPQQAIATWSIAPEYYLYHHTFKGQLFNSNGETINADIQIPRGIEKFDEIFEEVRELHFQEISLTASFTEQPTYLQVEYQGCAEAGLCYPPQTRNFQLDFTTNFAELIEELPVVVTTTSTVSNTTSASSENTGSTDIAENTKTEISTAETPAVGVFSAIILAMLGGAILNLMPCVLPVLSIKAISLTKTVHQPHLRHLHGWAYFAGVVACFLAIAIALLSLRAAGEAIGWGFQLQSPSVVAALAYLFFIMALSLAGLFHIGSNWMGLGEKYTNNKGLKSSFATGVLAAIVASPCTAPFMGAALGWAITQPSIIALAVFAALGAGMALPLTLLCHIPALLNKLPQPGGWMVRFKEFCAYPLLLTAVWLLWILGHQAGSDAVIVTLLGAVAIAFAIWLWQIHHALLKILAAGFVVIGLFIGINHQTLEADHSSQSSSTWEAYTPERLDELRNDNRPVFVNLTADWCITCLANEKVALSSSTFEAALQEKGITYLKGDWTNHNPEITKLLAQFNRNGVPLYLVYPSRAEKPEVLPQLLTEERVLAALDRAALP
ncbi:MAG: protein-disulfide reductase DsbD [Cellvibrionaceae bacterium]